MNLTTFYDLRNKALRDRKIPFDLEAPTIGGRIEKMLDETDYYAENTSVRMTHEEVFGSLRR